MNSRYVAIAAGVVGAAAGFLTPFPVGPIVAALWLLAGGFAAVGWTGRGLAVAAAAALGPIAASGPVVTLAPWISGVAALLLLEAAYGGRGVDPVRSKVLGGALALAAFGALAVLAAWRPLRAAADGPSGALLVLGALAVVGLALGLVATRPSSGQPKEAFLPQERLDASSRTRGKA